MPLNRNDPNWREKRGPAADSLTYAAGPRAAVAGNSGAAGVQAFEFLSGLAAALSKGPVELPCFPNVVIKIRDALNDPRTPPEATARLVGSEPRLAARLVQMANSAAFNSTGKHITDVRAAIVRLGHQLVQGTAVAFALQQIKNEDSMRPIVRSLTVLWKDSIAVASLCQVLARKTKVAPEEAFLCGLLHGIGRLYIMTHAVGKADHLNDDITQSGIIDSWQASIGKAVLENWDLPPAVSEAVGDQDDYERKAKWEPELADILIVGKLLAQHIDPEAADVLLELEDVGSVRVLHLDAQECKTVIAAAKEQLKLLQAALGC